MVVFSITLATHMRTSYSLKWICATLFHCGHLLFTWKTHCGLKFHFGQIDQSEICTEVSFTSPKLMWTLIMKLPYTEVKLYPEVKSQTGLSSLWVSCKCAQNVHQHWWHHLLNKKTRFLKLFPTFVTVIVVYNLC